MEDRCLLMWGSRTDCYNTEALISKDLVASMFLYKVDCNGQSVQQAGYGLSRAIRTRNGRSTKSTVQRASNNRDSPLDHVHPIVACAWLPFEALPDCALYACDAMRRHTTKSKLISKLILMWNRFHVTLRILSPESASKCLKVEERKQGQRKQSNIKLKWLYP